jgi:hypothetical protein
MSKRVTAPIDLFFCAVTFVRLQRARSRFSYLYDLVFFLTVSTRLQSTDYSKFCRVKDISYVYEVAREC